MQIEFSSIQQAASAIEGYVHQTPVVRSSSLSAKAGVPVHLKLEHHQRTGSFKIRGATNAVLSLSEEQKRCGVVGVSTGNHGRGLAAAAKQAGVRCIVCMSELVPQNKIDGIKSEGAEVRTIGRSQDDAQVEVDRLVNEEGMTMLPPFDHPKIIAGQGTLGLEMLMQIPELTTAVIQLSGGGLISGVAAAIKHQRPDVQIIGVSMERGAAMYQCIRAGRPIVVEELTTLADSLGGGIGLDNAYTFDMVQKLVDDIVLVSEKEIAEAIRHAYWEEHQIIEGSGSVGVAAVLANRLSLKGPTAVLLSGGNIDMSLHHRIVGGEDVDVT